MQTAMHPAFAEKLPGLAALLERTRLATAEFYTMVGRQPPPRRFRFHVINKGKAWHVIESHTGLTKGFGFTYESGCALRDALESGARTKLVARR